MAEDTIGFDVQNGIGETDWATLSQYVGAILPVINTVGTHTVRTGATPMTVDVTNGISAAFGARHNITTITNLTIDPVTLSGAVRWDAIVKRFDWSTNSAPIIRVPGTAAVNAQEVLPSGMLTTPGQKYDELLALVKATNGSTALEIVDRRIWGNKQFVVATPRALPPATTALYGVSVYVVSESKSYRCLLVSGSMSWVLEATGVTELTGSGVLKTVQTGFNADSGSLVNRCLVSPYSRQIDLEFRRSGAELNANNTDGGWGAVPVVVLQDVCIPDRPTPVTATYVAPDGRQYGAFGRLDADGTLFLLNGVAARNLAQSTAVGTVSLRFSIRFDKRTA